MKKTSHKFYPASYQLAVKKTSFFSNQIDEWKVQRCKIDIHGNIREMNAKLHWKPISKITDE